MKNNIINLSDAEFETMLKEAMMRAREEEREILELMKASGEFDAETIKKLEGLI